VLLFGANLQILPETAAFLRKMYRPMPLATRPYNPIAGKPAQQRAFYTTFSQIKRTFAGGL